MKQLYVSDLDGTLLNSKGQLTAFSKRTINRLIDQGLHFSIATARSWNSAEPIIAGLNLKLPLVLYNGVLVFDPISKSNIQENFIPQKEVEFIIDTFEKSNIEPILFTLNQKQDPSAFYKAISNEHMATYIKVRMAQKDRRFKQISTFNQAKKENTITIISIGQKEPLEQVKSLIEPHCNVEVHFAEDVYYKNAYWLEFTSKKSTKKSGVEFLRTRLQPELITVFGDNLNDIPLFEAADFCYATQNARQELKSRATGVIESSENDAVAKFIEHEFLTQRHAFDN